MTAQENQTLFDIALQECGTAESAFAIARANGKSITDIITVGTEIIIPANNKTNKKVLNFYDANQIRPATGTNTKNNSFLHGNIGTTALQFTANLQSLNYYLLTT